MESIFRSGILVVIWLGCFFAFMGEHWLAVGSLGFGVVLMVIHYIKAAGGFQPVNDGMSEAEMREIEAKMDAEPHKCMAYGDPNSGSWFPDPDCHDVMCVNACYKRRSV